MKKTIYNAFRGPCQLLCAGDKQTDRWKLSDIVGKQTGTPASRPEGRKQTVGGMQTGVDKQTVLVVNRQEAASRRTGCWQTG